MQKASITRAELRQLFKDKRVILIDVRSEAEYNEKHIPGAINVPVEKLRTGMFMPGGGKQIVTVCGKGGGRSEQAANFIIQNLNTTARYLDGGTLGWFGEEE